MGLELSLECNSNGRHLSTGWSTQYMHGSQQARAEWVWSYVQLGPQKPDDQCFQEWWSTHIISQLVSSNCHSLILSICSYLSCLDSHTIVYDVCTESALQTVGLPGLQPIALWQSWAMQMHIQYNSHIIAENRNVKGRRQWYYCACS